MYVPETARFSYLLTKSELELSEEERARVKKAAKDLLDTLKSECLALEWRKSQTTRAAVKEGIRVILDTGLPERFDISLYERKVEAVYQHVYESYYGAGHSVYNVN
jgi:type I restriction enzyme R subunit